MKQLFRKLSAAALAGLTLATITVAPANAAAAAQVFPDPVPPAFILYTAGTKGPYPSYEAAFAAAAQAPLHNMTVTKWPELHSDGHWWFTIQAN